MNKKIILTCLLFAVLIASCNKQTATTTDTAANSNTELTNSMGSVILRDEGAEPVIIDIEKKRL